jgi:hypothetical protein
MVTIRVTVAALVRAAPAKYFLLRSPRSCAAIFGSWFSIRVRETPAFMATAINDLCFGCNLAMADLTKRRSSFFE